MGEMGMEERRSNSVGVGVEIEESGMEIVVRDETAEDRVYVALVKEYREGKSLLLWVLQNVPRSTKLVIVHVHRPAQTIPMMGGRFPASQLSPSQVKAYHQIERDKLNKYLDDYLSFCSQMKFQAEKLVVEITDDNISKGLLDLIAHRSVTKLVMGAAADKHYSKKMKAPKSTTAISLKEFADPSCKIWFVCKGNLICTRDSGVNGTDISARTSPGSMSSQFEQLRSRSLPQGRSDSSSPVQILFKNRSIPEVTDAQKGPITTIGTQGLSVTRMNSDMSPDPWGDIPRGSYNCVTSSNSTNSEGLGNSGPISIIRDEESETASVVLPSQNDTQDDLCSLSLNEDLEYFGGDDELYERWKHATLDAETSRREAYEETCRRQKAEKDAVKAQQKAKSLETVFAKEMALRKETEAALAREKMELERKKKLQDEAFAELQKAKQQKEALELRITESQNVLRDFEEKLSAAQSRVSSLQREHDELRQERDSAVKEAEVMNQRNKEGMNGDRPASSFSEFSYMEIAEATQNFNDLLKIGEGGFGSVYKGFLRHTTVAIKMLNPKGKQGLAEFQQEVDVLSRLRHPNLVTLIGTCSEAGALVYEFLSEGSLEDRLVRKDNSPALSWQLRTRIAAEICAALIFLHSSKPYSVVHGDLKPANILLDANFGSKVADFGISRLLSHSNTSTTTLYHQTHPRGTFVYMDPEFLSTGELTPKSDIYSFGVVILRLLTGKPGLGIIKEVQEAMQRGCLHELIDRSAGEWPFIQAKQLAQIGLKCCEMERKRRPDLANEVWKVLAKLTRAISVNGSGSYSFRSISDDSVPSYFICPILQEVMKDPHIAADGFTYEAKAIKGWIESGNFTSPMTNLKLPHCELTANHTLRSAIQEWQEQHKPLWF